VYTPEARSLNLEGSVTTPAVDASNLTVNPELPQAAPNLTAGTVTVVPTKLGNQYYYELTATVTLPGAYADIANIQMQIAGLDMDAIDVPAPYTPISGQITFTTKAYPMPLTPQSYTANFVVTNSVGQASATPLAVGFTVSPSQISGLTITEVGPRTLDGTTTIAVTPTLTNTNGIQQVTLWATWDGGLSIYGLGVFSYYPGATTVIDVSVPLYPVASQAGLAGGVGSNNFKVYLVDGAQTFSATTPMSLSAFVAAYPSEQASNAITVLAASPPAASTASATLINGRGAGATTLNVYAGLNSAGQPYGSVYASLVTAGLNDPNTATYAMAIQWTNASGTPIDIGGTNSAGQANLVGWQLVESGIPNDGGTHPVNLTFGYPAPGVDAYLAFAFWGCNGNFFSDTSHSQYPPYTSNPNAVQQNCWSGSSYGLLHVGQPPGTQSGSNVTNAPSTGNPTGAVVYASPNTGHSLLLDWDFGLTPLGTVVGTNLAASKWGFGFDAANSSGYTAAAGSIAIRNDGGASSGGVQNYCRLTGPNSNCQQTMQIPAGQAFFVSFAARSNNPTLSVVCLLTVGGTGSGYANGTYTGVALNGLGGTGATATVTISGNVVTDVAITNQGGSYTPGGTFNVSLTVGGGTGLFLTCWTGQHALSCAVSAYDANNASVLVNSNATNYFSISGSQASWQNPAASGVLAMPSNVKYVIYDLYVSFAEPPTGYWDVSLAVFQPVQNQDLTALGQTNSGVPTASSGAYTGLYTVSNTTTASSEYGQAGAVVSNSNGCNASMTAPSGAGFFAADGGTSASASLNISGPGSSGAAGLTVVGPSADYAFEVSALNSGLQVTVVEAGTPFNGATGSRSIDLAGGGSFTMVVKNGIVTSF
jgi:hypothetical protein